MPTAYRQNKETNDKTDNQIVVKKVPGKGKEKPNADMKDYSDLAFILQLECN